MWGSTNTAPQERCCKRVFRYPNLVNPRMIVTLEDDYPMAIYHYNNIGSDSNDYNVPLQWDAIGAVDVNLFLIPQNAMHQSQCSDLPDGNNSSWLDLSWYLHEFSQHKEDHNMRLPRTPYIAEELLATKMLWFFSKNYRLHSCDSSLDPDDSYLW